MGEGSCDIRYRLILVGVAFIYAQVKLFATQSEYADKVTAAVEAEDNYRNQMQLLINQISTNQQHIVGLEEKVKLQKQECEQLRAVVQELENRGGKKEYTDDDLDEIHEEWANYVANFIYRS